MFELNKETLEFLAEKFVQAENKTSESDISYKSPDEIQGKYRIIDGKYEYTPQNRGVMPLYIDQYFSAPRMIAMISKLCNEFPNEKLVLNIANGAIVLVREYYDGRAGAQEDVYFVKDETLKRIYKIGSVMEVCQFFRSTFMLTNPKNIQFTIAISDQKGESRWRNRYRQIGEPRNKGSNRCFSNKFVSFGVSSDISGFEFPPRNVDNQLLFGV